MQTTAATIADILAEKITNRTARVGIIGLGYVGLPLAMEFAKAGFSVTGIDVQESKVAQLNRGESYIQDVPNEILRPLVESKKFQATTDFSVAGKLDTINIAVPTPLRKTIKRWIRRIGGAWSAFKIYVLLNFAISAHRRFDRSAVH